MDNPPSQPSVSQGKWKGSLTATKDGLDIARQLIVIVILLLLLLWPALIQKSLDALGINKISAGGVGFERVQKTSETTGGATQELIKVNETLRPLPEQLSLLAQQITDPRIKNELENLKNKLKSSLQTTNDVEQDLTASLEVQNSFLQSTSPEDIKQTGPWGIVVSADKSFVPDARDEVKKAQDLGYQNVKVYYRQQWYRTVIVFSNLADAQTARLKLRSKNRDSAYLVDMTKWCPTSKVQENGVLNCDDS